MILQYYREDPEKQKDGTPIYIEDATFYVRRWGTPESIKKRKELSQALFGPLHKYTQTDDSLLLAHWLVEYGVSNWENVFEDDKDSDSGKELQYSESNARKVFLNEEYFLSLNELLFKESVKFENYLYDAAEESIEEIKKP